MQFNEMKGSDVSIAILMTTYNAGQYLKQQLDSFEQQSFSNWKLYVSDDGSNDATTLTILSEYRQRWGEDKIYIFTGPGQGFAKNFLSLICKDEIKADFYAFSDQDDIWEYDKLHKAIEKLSVLDDKLPILYGARTLLVDEDNNELGLSTLFKKKTSLQNAMVQSIAGGNTMVMNNVTRDILHKAGMVDVISHDWWAYLVVTAFDGIVVYDNEAHVRYRQHSKNLMGSNTGFTQKIYRLKGLCNGEFSIWIDRNLLALNNLYYSMPEKQKQIITEFKRVRCSGLIKRIWGLKKLKLYRQTISGNIGLYLAFIFGKI